VVGLNKTDNCQGGTFMIEYRDLPERRHEPSTRLLERMNKRRRRLTKGNCFIGFEDRDPDDPLRGKQANQVTASVEFVVGVGGLPCS
jgi:hypothetical protein